MKNIILFIFLIYSSLQLISQAPLQHRPKIGLVLSGGGAKGFAHIGVLKVLEKAGIPIDFIGGTSMGSIIGGLYSIGYSADSIQKMVESQNWPELMSDRFPRKYLSFEEKENDGKFFVPFPIHNGKFQLPVGVIPGQNLELLLSRLTWNACDINDFNKLPIPFLCMATDIERGEAVIMNKGSLPKCIRASLAIPTIFTPVVIDEQTLVDGGLYNNFPVEAVKKMGADIIIGVDIGFEPFHGKELNSMLRVIEQSVFIHTVEKNRQQQALCNIFIKPDLREYNMMNFDRSDSLIIIGERAANAIYTQLKKLSDSLKSYRLTDSIKTYKLPVKKTFKITDIQVNGNNNTPRNYIITKLNIEAPSNVDVDKLEEAVMRVYGTMLYKKVTYSILPSEKGNVLEIDVEERPQSLFTLGVNYNTDYLASIYLNASWYNLLRPGSKLSFDALLGENPKLDVTYFVFSGWNPGGLTPTKKGWRFDFGINTSASHFNIIDYKNGRKVSSSEFTDISASIYTQTIFRNSYAWGIGIQNQYSVMNAGINSIFSEKTENFYLNFYSYLKFDTYNHSYFPSKGMQLNMETRYLSNIYDASINPSLLVNLKYGISIPINSRFTINTGIYSGLTFADTIPNIYQIRVGGITTYYLKSSIPFVGHKLLEYNCLNAMVLRFDLQYELFRRNYITLKSNIGALSDKPGAIYGSPNTISGYGISYGYNSLIGPMELTFMSSPTHNFLVCLNIGFWF
jgi:NTE family protein